MARSRFLRRSLAIGCVALSAVTLAACSGSGSASGGGGKGSTYTVWDPYPQFTNDSAWVRTLQKCGSQYGVKINRTGYDTTALVNKVLLAAQQGDAPNILVVDNPVVSTLAQGGVLQSTESLHLSTSDIESNILGAGQVDGKTYGVPVGANTLALYYNKTILDAAHVDPSSITSWATLTAALAKVKAAGKGGITFSAIGTEEGSFQFLPWFWGAGGKLTDLDSTQGAAALNLLKGWLQKGYAPNSVLQDTQEAAWQTFDTGDYAFAENGTWNLASAKTASFPYGVITIPGENGGSAPVPTGGEFVTVPVNKSSTESATSAKIVSCLTGPAHALATDTALTYVSAVPSLQSKQVASDAALSSWVTAVHSAKGRTSDGLGSKYPKISEQMWGAEQDALSGSSSVTSALQAAQTAASK